MIIIEYDNMKEAKESGCVKDHKGFGRPKPVENIISLVRRGTVCLRTGRDPFHEPVQCFEALGEAE